MYHTKDGNVGRRNHFKGARFTADEIELIQRKADEKKLNLSDFIRKGALEYAGKKTNPLPEPVEKWVTAAAKIKLIEILGPEPNAIRRLKEFFGRR